jgi:hypothetical protein
MKIGLYHLYLKYMAILSRQLLTNIIKNYKYEINPCILSNQINYGMWGLPSEFNYWLRIDEEQDQPYSHTNMIMNPIQYF